MLRTEIEGLEILSERLKTALGTNIRAIVAFGSRVRGDFNWESDFDVLVVVEQKDYSVVRLITDTCLSIEEERGIPLSAVVKDLKTFQAERQYNTGFYRNIKKEGLVIYGAID